MQREILPLSPSCHLQHENKVLTFQKITLPYWPLPWAFTHQLHRTSWGLRLLSQNHFQLLHWKSSVILWYLLNDICNIEKYENDDSDWWMINEDDTLLKAWGSKFAGPFRPRFYAFPSLLFFLMILYVYSMPFSGYRRWMTMEARDNRQKQQEFSPACSRQSNTFFKPETS